MLLIKLVSVYFSILQEIVGQFLENLKINIKPWENDFGLISWKIILGKTVGKFSVNVSNVFVFHFAIKIIINWTAPTYLCKNKLPPPQKSKK